MTLVIKTKIIEEAIFKKKFLDQLSKSGYFGVFTKIDQILESPILLLQKPYTLFSNPCQSVRECPKILKICQITQFDMGFQKINMISRYEKVDFLFTRFSQTVALK
jgi:hypothetical protein